MLRIAMVAATLLVAESAVAQETTATDPVETQPPAEPAPPEASADAESQPTPTPLPFQRVPLVLDVYGAITGSYVGRFTNGFALGQVDFFVTSRPHKSLNLLSEVVFKTNKEQAFIPSVERILATWVFHQRFRLTAGRFHQAFGYYNTAYHHGTYLMNTIKRPAVIAAEDSGGLLPLHAVGVEGAGDWVVGPVSIGYSIALGNGRSHRPEDILNVTDLNPTKSVLGALTLTHPGTGLRIGINALGDRIPSNTGTPHVYPALESIWGAHLLLDRELVWLLAEGYVVDHTSVQTHRVQRSKGVFTEGRFNMRPVYFYARFDWVALAPQPLRKEPSTRSGLLGVGWKVVSGLVLKVEGGAGFPAGKKAAPLGQVQLAWQL